MFAFQSLRSQTNQNKDDDHDDDVCYSYDSYDDDIILIGMIVTVMMIISSMKIFKRIFNN